MLPVPLDEYPIHQTPAVAALRRLQRPQLLRPRLLQRPRPHRRHLPGHRLSASTRTSASTDAYATVRRGDRQWTVRCSDALGHDDRLAPAVGPYRVEVLRAAAAHPARVRRRRPRPRLRPDVGGLVPGGHGAAPRHARRRPGHPRRLALRPGRHLGGRAAGRRRRDRRRRPTCGSGPGTGRGASGPSARASRPDGPADDPTAGLWWLYVPLRFDDFAVIVIVQEQPDGFRTLNDATRVWPDGRVEQLGLARDRDRLRARHPPPRAGLDPAHRAGRQAADARGRVARLRGPPRRRRLRRRPRLGPRAVAGRGLGRGCGVRPDRPGRRRRGCRSA